MSSFSIQNVAGSTGPTRWGHAAARASGARLWDYWNGPTASSRVAELEAGGRWRRERRDSRRCYRVLVRGRHRHSGSTVIGADNVGLALGRLEDRGFRRVAGRRPGPEGRRGRDYPGELAAGDILYASARRTRSSRLPVGSDGQILGLESGRAGVGRHHGRRRDHVLRHRRRPGARRRATTSSGQARRHLARGRERGGHEGRRTASSAGSRPRSIADGDKVPFSDEGETGDPNRAITFSDFKSALNIPAAATGFDLYSRT